MLCNGLPFNVRGYFICGRLVFLFFKGTRRIRHSYLTTKRDCAPFVDRWHAYHFSALVAGNGHTLSCPVTT